MIQQTEINFVHERENNPVSQNIVDDKRVKLNSQVVKILRLLAYGNRLTQWGAYSEHNIGDLRRRIKDMEEKIGIRAKRDYEKGTHIATYYFNEEQKLTAIEKLNKLK